ncbi:MAG: general secretion pathway protein GspK [Nitrospirae bacterium]|nr:general secretion pathway protein GspK [Nitrospirota bacterium]
MKRKYEGGRMKSEINSFTSKFKIHNSQDGIALMMVLWILVLLSIIALNYLNASRWNTTSTRNLKEETISYYMAMSGYQEAVNYILSDKDTVFDFYDGDGNFRVDRESQPITGKRAVGRGEVDIRITDEGSLININHASRERLRRLFAYIGVPDETLDELVDSVLDWKDPDKEHHLSGAEDDYYEDLEEPYKAKNAFFDLPEELALVKGMTKDYLYGAGELKPLLGLITTFGSGSLNINTVSTEVMELMGLDAFEIEAVLKQRSAEAGGFTFVPQPFSARGFNAIAAQNLRVEVTARAHSGVPGARIVAVLNRQPVAKGYKIQTLYWRESAENNRG